MIQRRTDIICIPGFLTNLRTRRLDRDLDTFEAHASDAESPGFDPDWSLLCFDRCCTIRRAAISCNTVAVFLQLQHYCWLTVDRTPRIQRICDWIHVSRNITRIMDDREAAGQPKTGRLVCRYFVAEYPIANLKIIR